MKRRILVIGATALPTQAQGAEILERVGLAARQAQAGRVVRRERQRAASPAPWSRAPCVLATSRRQLDSKTPSGFMA